MRGGALASPLTKGFLLLETHPAAGIRTTIPTGLVVPHIINLKNAAIATGRIIINPGQRAEHCPL